MPVEYYNMTKDGKGFEGLLSWANSYVNGWLTTAFIFVVFVVGTYVLSKSEWKMTNVISFMFSICLMLSFMVSLFTTVTPQLIVICIIGLSINIFWNIIGK